MPGVVTLPPNPNVLPAIQSGQAWHRRGRPRQSAVDVMPAGSSSIGLQSTTDRSFEISANGTRQMVTAESRPIVRPVRRSVQRRKVGEGEAPEAGYTFVSEGADDDHEEHGSGDEWEEVEDTVRPEETLDANGDPIDSEDELEDEGNTGKRKAYASSVRPLLPLSS